MAGPEIRVLGPLHLSLDGHDAPLGTPMQRAVLGRLVVARGQAVTTDRLIDDLWSGQPPPRAAAVLQVHIHTLRRLLEPHRARRAPARYIVSESSGYALRIAETAVDAWYFEQRLRAYQELISNPAARPDAARRISELDAVLGHWHGPALEAFADTEWAAAETDRLTDLHLTAIEMNAQTKLELERFGEVVLELRALFDEHPGREELVRLLATAQYRTGQQLEALTTIRRSREFLGREFGVDPAPAVRHLESAILNHATELRAPPHAPRSPGTARPTAGAATSTPAATHTASAAAQPAAGFAGTAAPEHPAGTGYTAELGELLALGESVRAGGLRLVWITGEAGLGKSTLAEAALGALAATGWQVAIGGCPEIDGAPPAWAWAEILDAAAGFAGAVDAGTPPEPVPADAFGMSRTLAERCHRAGAAAPVALLLEDVHRADTATLQVLRQLASWLRDEPVLVLLTTRRSEAVPGVHNTAAALAPQTALRLRLSGLDPEGTRQVARAAGLAPVDEDLVHRLHRRTGGNPLFVRELAKLLAAHGDLEQVPESIRELIDDRVARLPAGVTEVLRHIAIWGTGIELGTLSSISGVTRDALIDLVTAAETAGLVGARGSGRIDFEHTLIRDAVYLGIPALRRGRMHWAALELLAAPAAAHARPAPDPEVLARHAFLGATPETAWHAIEYVRVAARHRMKHRMRSETVRLLRSAVQLHELAGHTGEYAARRDRVALLELRCTLVTALAYDNRHGEARAERLRALTMAEELGDDELLHAALTSWRVPVIWAIREWRDPDHRVRQALSRALASLDALPPQAADRAGATAANRTAATDHFKATEHVTAADHTKAAAHTTATERTTEPDHTTATERTTEPDQIAGTADTVATGYTTTDEPAAGAELASASGNSAAALVADAAASVYPAGGTARRGPHSKQDAGGQTSPAGEFSAAVNPAGSIAKSEVAVRLRIAASFEAGLEEYGAGQALAREALALARELGDAELVCAAINALTYVEFDYDAEFVALTTEMERVAEAAGLTDYRALAHYQGYRVAVARIDLREAGRRAAHTLECADEGQLQPLLDMVGCFAATMELLRGEVTAAERLYEQFGRRIRRSGSTNATESELFCAMAIGWARGNLSGLVDRIAASHAELPSVMAQPYALALVHADRVDAARAVFERTDPRHDGPYPVLMSALRAHTAIALGNTDSIRTLYEFLLPHTGTVIGVETGMASFGPMDAVLAALADAAGDSGAGDVHREQASGLLERIRAELPRAGDSPLRAA
ncbi:BTAD domain-containing putative transcriptional regulator [Nocardia sp. NPDC005978]|uniref:BTAD domain-containing putative transcriptional regulator n=1 Tax=Nocardia sp. NPDC005978 TaxID=3156725 RepID=UPI0033BE1FC5